MNQRSKVAPQHPIVIVDCTERAEAVHIVEQLLDQRRQFSVISDDDVGGWIISYSSGPNKT